MKTSKVLLVLAAILSFDLSLFQALISLRPKWSAAFQVPPQLLADRQILLAAGLLVSMVVALFGLYALSGAGALPRFPFLRPALLSIGCGYAYMGVSFIPQLLALFENLPSADRIPLRLVAASFVVLITGLSYLAGLAFGWKHLATGPREPMPGIPRRPAATEVRAQS